MLELSQALKLSADRFTPLARTPWAGFEIQRRYKTHISPQSLAIGESWEVSCDPDFPSEVLSFHRSLLDLVKMAPKEMLSEAYILKKGVTCEILIKLLNADQALSVQVHPRDDDPSLSAHECGKPESWLILHAEEGAGLYLGFSRRLDPAKLRTLLEENADLRPFLQFVPVTAGDYFEIQPGVPHAIGPGITLLEPQRVILGKSGKTYRFWDWGRRYDAKGKLDLAHGNARELHLVEGMRLIDPEHQVGLSFVNSLRRQPKRHEVAQGIAIEVYPSNDSYQVYRVRLQSEKAIEWHIQAGFGALVVLEGVFVTQHRAGQVVDFKAGEPGFLPFASFPLVTRCVKECDFIFVIPAGAQLTWTI